MSGFFSRLSYSLGNEDWETENRALQVQPGNRTLCVTGSGDRALHCLLTEGEEVIAIDANSMQSHLIELKAAALKKLDFPDYLSFLGVTPSNRRLNYLPDLREHMSEAAFNCWMNRPAMIANGVLYQGHVERRCQIIAGIIRKLRGKKVEKLFSASHLDEQRQLVDAEWNNWSWKKAFDWILHPRLGFTKRWLKDPGLYEEVSSTIHVGRYLYERMDDYLHRGLARESIILSLLLLGQVKPEGLPPYLTAEGWKAINKKVDRLTVRTQNVMDALEKGPEESFDRFSLSDIASYMNLSNFHRLARGMYRSARPGARFCIRQFLSNHELPPEIANRIQREPELEKELEIKDRCFVYRYIVGTVRK